MIELCIFDIFLIFRLRDFCVDLQKICANAERLLASLLSRGQEAKLEKLEKNRQTTRSPAISVRFHEKKLSCEFIGGIFSVKT